MIYFFLAEGFEEIEALCPIDLLRRAGLEVKTVGVGGKVIRGAHGIKVTADILDTEYNDKAPELIFLPGGMPGTLNLKASDTVQRAIKEALECDAYIAAICAAPMIPGKRGLLKGRRAVCYPGFEKYLEGAVLTGGRVEADGPYVTGCGMGAALEFSLTLTRLLKGDEAADQLFASVLAK